MSCKKRAHPSQAEATMKTTCVASTILLMLSLAGLSAAAAVSDDSIMDAIRLPSDGTALADLLTAMTRATRLGEEKRRPWTCCDVAVCTRSFPPTCRCLDKVDRCSGACEKCEETEDSRHICADWYHGFPGPKCNEDGGLADLGVTFGAGKMKRERDEARPWNCCDLQICTKSFPPTCQCWDEVERCANACKRCEEVEGSGHSRYRCRDAHRGDPAPPCDRQGAADAILRGYGY